MGAGPQCGRFDSFDKSVAALPAAGIDVTLRLRFHSDGARRLRCRTGALSLGYLRKVGWISVPCEDAGRG